MLPVDRATRGRPYSINPRSSGGVAYLHITEVVATYVAIRRYSLVVRNQRKLCVVCSRVFRSELATCPEDGAPLVVEAGEEQRASRLGHVVGSYRLIRVLGEGGIGTVYEAEHLRLGRRIALKLLHADVMIDELAIRFFNEARAVNEIRHPNIIDVEDFGTTADGEHYMLMELLVGEDLRTTLDREHTMAPERVAALAGQLASALAAVHAVGIVHRDLKPENIFLSQKDGREQAKLLDFGIAKFLGQTGVTRAGMTMGTPQYMAPEQIISGQLTEPASDLYSLGMVMYECLTGAPAFTSPNLASILRAQCSEVPVPPSQRRGEAIAPVIEAAVLKCLAKEPGDRFASGTALHDALLGATPVAYVARRHSTSHRAATARPRRSRRAVQMIPAFTMAIAALVLHLSPRSTNEAEATPVAIVAPAPHSVPPAPPVTVAPATIELELASRPSGAKLFLGETRTPLGNAPARATLPMSSDPITLLARFEDGTEVVETIVPDRPRDPIVFVAPVASSARQVPKRPTTPSGPAPKRTDREGTLDPFRK